MDLDRKRWLILLACILANVVQGAAYASSVFAKPIMELLKCSKAEWAMAFSLSVAFLPVGMLISGKIADQRSPRLAVALGGLLLGAGMFLAGYSHSLIWLYTTFGVMLSLGSGAAYGASIAVAVRWFPDKRGMASGLSVGALGFGTAVLALVAQRLMPHLGVLGVLRVFGIAFVAILALASLILVNPPKDYAPRGSRPADSEQSTSANDLSWSQMLAKPRFWLLYALYAFGAFSGLMVISQASPIAQEMTKLSEIAAAGLVSLLGLANATGRVVWGSVSDRLGRLNSLALMFLVTLATMLLLPNLALHRATLIPAFILVGTCYGGYLGTFPSLCADTFGAKNMAVNYALMFSAFSIAGVTGPRIGAKFGQSQAGYPQAFVTAGVIAAVGLALALVLIVADARARRTRSAGTRVRGHR